MSRVLKIILGLVVVAVFAMIGVFGTAALVARDDGGSGEEGGEQQPTRVGVTSPQTETVEDAISAVGTLRWESSPIPTSTLSSSFSIAN